MNMVNDSVPGTKRQDRIQRTQHRPEQNEGYDEAVQQGGQALPNDTNRVSYMPAQPADASRVRELSDIDDREARRAAADVRRHEHSAD
jgi:hypothetical protein